MASPAGHGLIAVLATRLLAGEGNFSYRWLGFALVAVLAPDLDFLPGILIGDPGRFHHGASHSLFFALLFSGLAALLAGMIAVPRARVAIAAGLLYGSHLLLDLLTKDTGAPFGQPLLWPFSDTHFALAAPPLSNIIHGGPDRDLVGFLGAVFSTHNLLAVMRELVLLLPPAAALWLLMNWSRSTRCRAVAWVERRGSRDGSPSSIVPD